jgi:hypothetical protein
MFQRDAKLWAACLWACTWLSPAAAAPRYAGIYVVAVPFIAGSAANLALGRAYAKPFVDGVMIPLHWSYIEPVAPGQVLADGAGPTNPFTGEQFCAKGTRHTNFCWQELDEQLLHMPHSKKLSLAVVAGGFTPAWLASPAYGVATTGNVFYASHNGTGSNCFTISLPLISSAPFAGGQAPSSYAAGYVAVVQAIAAHLAAVGALSQVAIVKVSGGVNTVTQEFHIDAATTSNACLTATTPIWAQLGYTPAATQAAWAFMAPGVAAAFPNALASFDILESSFAASPMITNGGVVFTPAQYAADPSAYGTLLLDSTLAALVPGGGTPGVLGTAPVSVQWDGLAPADQQTLSTVATHTLAAGARGAVLGFQANEMFGAAGSSCGTAACASAVSPATTCYGAATCVNEFQSLLENGINPVPGTNAHAAFLEVWAVDAVNSCLGPALAAAHNTLTGSGLSLGRGC